MSNTNKEILWFDGNKKISLREYNTLKKLANGKENLSSFRREDLINLKNVLKKQLKEYEARQNVSESSKKRITKLTYMAINYVDKVLDTKQKSTSTKSVETKKAEPKKVVKKTTHMKVQTQIPENSKKKENTETKNSFSVKKAENKFNERLKEYLDPKKTIVFDLDGNVVTLKFDNTQKKNQAEEMFKKLEETFGDDKLAAYSVVAFLKKYKNNIQTVEEIYEKAGKWLYGNQVVISKDKKRDLALLDAAKNKNVKIIEVDTWNKFFNALLNTITFNLVDIDTANVSQKNLDNENYGKKATSKDLFYGYYKIERKSWDENRIEYTNDKDSADTNDNVISLQEPLKHFTKEKLISEFADKIEDYLRNPNKKVDSVVKKLAEEYLKANGINHKSLEAVDLKSVFRQDKAIKKWLKESQIIDKMATKDDVIEITKDGFFHINHPKELFSKDFVKVKLDNVDGKNKEVLMKVSKATYKDLFGKDTDVIAKKLANMPPIVLKDGSILAYTKEGIVVLGDKVGNGADAIRDFLERHETAAAAVAGGIIGALLVKGVNIDLSGLGDALKKLGKPFENLGKWLKENWKNVLDAFKNMDVTKLEAFGLGYLTTAVPLNYKIEALEEKYAKLYGDDRGAQAVKAEIDAIVDNPLMVNDKNLIYNEAQSLFGHYVLVKTGLFKPGEATGVDTKVKKSTDKYKITLDNITEDSKIILAGKELYLKDGNKLEIEVKKHKNNTFEVQNIYGKLMVDVVGKDDFIKFTGDKATYYETHLFGKADEKKTVSIKNKSMDKIVKELTKKDKKYKKNKK